MYRRSPGVIVLVLANRALAVVFSYECSSLPPDAGWQTLQNWCDAQDRIDDGWLWQRVDFCPGYDPPTGQQSSYTRSLGEFGGSESFFLEWRVQTSSDRSEIPFGGGALFSAWSRGSVNYQFTFAADQVRFVRDNRLPTVWADIDPGVSHTFRLDLFADARYVWFIDGISIDTGVPEGSYPSSTPAVNFRAKAIFVESTTIWDYIRWGDIPTDASGDFDSDGALTLFDYYFVEDCLTKDGPGIFGGPGANAGPGCRFADFDSDGDVDFLDFAEFQNDFDGSQP